MTMIYDISVGISSTTPVASEDEQVSISSRLGQGNRGNVSLLSLSLHCGTHVVAPYYLDNHGATVEALPLATLTGKTLVVEIDADNAISVSTLQAFQVPRHTQRLLLKTRNSALWEKRAFCQDHVYLTVEAAEWIAEAGVKLVGIDYVSVDRYGNTDQPVLRTLLKENIIVVQGLDLSSVEPGYYQLLCLPLKIMGEASPARVVLTDLPEGK